MYTGGKNAAPTKDRVMHGVERPGDAWRRKTGRRMASKDRVMHGVERPGDAWRRPYNQRLFRGNGEVFFGDWHYAIAVVLQGSGEHCHVGGGLNVFASMNRCAHCGE
jgi:hypothetical protein